jgi:hypothetical protein
MASYLNHVAAKAVGQTAALQPRVPSLFEPPPALRSARLTPFPFLKVDSDTRFDSADSSTPQLDWRSRNLRRPETPVASIDDQHSGRQGQIADKDPGPVSRITGHKRREPVPIEPVLSAADETTDTPSTPDSRTKPRIVPLAATRTEHARADAIGPPESADIGITAPSPKAPPLRAARSEATPPGEPDARDPDQRLSTRPEVHDVTPPERAEVVTQSLRPVPRVPTFRRAEARDGEDTERGFSVSVVIGRVNVQAVLPQPAPVRLTHSAPAPMLSLDQYLKQRGGHS